MKSNVLRAVLLTAAVGGLLASGAPAQAAETQWDDPAGDANGFVIVPSNPGPSEPTLDLLKVNYTTTTDSLIVTAQLQEFGNGCGRCSVKNDAKAKKVGVMVPFNSLSAAMKAEDPDQPKVGPGAKFEALSATSQRSIGLITASTDTAVPKEGTTLTL